MTEVTTTVSAISCSAAQQLVAHVTGYAKSNGLDVAVAILDPSGAVVASARMDGVSPIILEIATDKAFTANLG